MLIRVDPASDRPLYAQIADSVRGDLASGLIAVGRTLPPAREIATGLGINVHTVLRAYQQLRDEGLVDLRRGRGAVVTAAAAELAELHRGARALAAHAQRLGIGPDALGSLVAGIAGTADPAVHLAEPVARTTEPAVPATDPAARSASDTPPEGTAT